MATIDERVPVLIVGGGYAGLAASLFLSHHGVRSILVDRHLGVSVQGRARGINPRTMEIYRPLGLEPAIREAGRPFDGETGVARCRTLSGDWEWILNEDAPLDWQALSPAPFCMADQSSVEPVLIAAARARGADIRFDTRLVSFAPDAAGVSAVIEEGARGRRTVRSDYLIAADGHRSPIREQLGIARPGPGATKHWMSIVFDADLSAVIQRRALFWIVLNPRLGFAGFVSTATPGRWGLSVGYDPSRESPADFTPARCVEVVRAAVGRPDLPVQIVDIGAWEEAVGVADAYRAGRIFLVGDSAHVWPPAGAMGANSAVQDAHNLAWKLAAVVKGAADDRLLDTYEAERRPVALELARLTVRRQEARFGGGEEDPVDDMISTLGQRYRSAAILGNASAVPFGGPVSARFEAGARMPHLWLERDGRRLSTLDLCHDAFVLLTGDEGQPWLAAAAALAPQLGIPLRAYRVGRSDGGADLGDPYEEWGKRGTGAHGAALVRPDGYVAWLTPDSSDDVLPHLTHALRRILRPATE